MSAGDRRERVLGAVRAAIAGAQEPEVPREYATDLGPMTPEQRIELFAERVTEYRAEVQVVAPANLSRTIGNVLSEHKIRSLVVPPDIDPGWLTTVTCEVTPDRPDLTAGRLDGIGAVVTGCAVAIALTGTIVLDAGAAQGRRAISLVPDLHVCVVRADQIVGSVPEGVRRLDAGRPLTWISGPSATSDIELNRVEGVHGPRTLVVLIVS